MAAFLASLVQAAGAPMVEPAPYGAPRRPPPLKNLGIDIKKATTYGRPDEIYSLPEGYGFGLIVSEMNPNQ